MKFELFNQALFSKKGLEKTLEKLFPENPDINVNIVFVDKGYIKKLNKDFRKKDEVTDVLSFNSTNEIYVCPEYIASEEGVLRLILHGILHLKGYEHKGYFDAKKIEEEMFVLQEMYLKKFYDILKK